MADVRALEYPTLKVPYEIFKKKYHSTQKYFDRDITQLQKTCVDLERSLDFQGISASEISPLLGNVIDKLTSLKQKSDATIADEVDALNICKRRLDHLRGHTGTDINIKEWRQSRLNRMLIEYFLCRGYYSSAGLLVQQANLQDLTNFDIFISAREVEQSLQRHETAKCIAWCYDNRSRLRKIKSSLEFDLRVQEFVELVKSNKRLDAVMYARKYFSKYEDKITEIKQCMALLAFPTTTQIVPYTFLLCESRWNMLTEKFRYENCKLFQYVAEPVFTIALQTGLSALKTPQCYNNSDTKNKVCPLCRNDMNELASSLPFANCSQSRLTCSLSGLPLNEDNVPMMLPNGRVYGLNGLKKMANDNNGFIICPKTGEIYPVDKLEKVYVMN